MIQMFSSATRVTLLVLIAVLCAMNIYSLIYYPDTLFVTVFGVFKDIVLMSATYFYAKSTSDSKPTEPVNTKDVEKEVVDITSK